MELNAVPDSHVKEQMIFDEKESKSAAETQIKKKKTTTTTNRHCLSVRLVASRIEQMEKFSRI
jgi:hypothetical protein